MIHADLHLHTTYSVDSTIQPKTLIEKLVAHSHIKACAVTDHGNTRGTRLIQEMASAHQDILIIPGVEISTTQGDIILLGTEETPTRPWTVESVLDFARQNDCVTIVAHPYREYGLGDQTRNYTVDAIEIFNGASSQESNKQAKDLAKLMKLPGVAGSDAHFANEVCTVYTEIDADLHVDEILGAIRQGKVKVPSSVKGSIRF